MDFQDIKPGQFLFYTERPYSNYADSLCEVVEWRGELYPKWICINNFGKYVSEESSDEDWSKLGEFDEDSLRIKDYYDPKCWHLTNYNGKEKVVDFMEREFRLDSHFLPLFLKEEVWVFIDSLMDLAKNESEKKSFNYSKRRLSEQLNNLIFGSYEA